MKNIIENIDWLITAFTFLGGIYMYINNTRRLNQQQVKLNDQQKLLNKQQELLNEYQLQKSKEEILEKKQALIEANVYKTSDRKGNPIWRMKVYNKGKAKGSNINFKSETLSNDQGIIITDGLEMFPLPSLLPQGSVELSIILFTSHQPMHKIRFTWEDESGKERFQEQDVIFQ